jgi:hypothetical protein
MMLYLWATLRVADAIRDGMIEVRRSVFERYAV